MDDTRGLSIRGSCSPQRGLPSLMELMVSLERELALRTCEWRELAISAAGVFIPELEQGGVLEVEASSRSEL